MLLAGSHAGVEQTERFRGEAGAVARFSHPGIVQVFEIGEHEGRSYFSLEFVKGGTLDRKLAGTPLPPREAAELAETLARAMAYAHQHQIIHRDLKPANILLTSEGAPKIADFGLAKTIGAAGNTATGTVMGTPSYMAPEQARGSAEVGPAADIYALGSVLYETLTGRPPFRADNPLETLRQVLADDPVPPSRLQPKTPRDLETICLKCLEKDPTRRYASAEALADDLRRFQDGVPIKERPISAAERLWRWSRRYPSRALAAGVALLALVVILAGGAWFNRQLRGQNEQLQMRLVEQAAEKLDGELRQFATIPRLMAATLTQRADWTEAQLEKWMREVLQQDPRVYGTCIAFEPFRFDPGRRDYALYVYRPPAGLTTKVLDLPAYEPLYREWDWYSRTAKERRPGWTEPFFDTGAGNIPLLSPTVPLEREGKLVGVVTIDLSLEYFQVLRQWLNELRVGETGYAFVVSPQGKIISHPNPAYQLLPITDIPGFRSGEHLHDLRRRLVAGTPEPGRVTAVDPVTEKPASFLFARVPSAGWSLVVVIGE
jgi:hypothetical protein